jgi:hypothetical protein
MSTDSIVGFLIATVVVVALQMQILQIKWRLRDMPGGAPKN